jgi:hypothetical protein
MPREMPTSSVALLTRMFTNEELRQLLWEWRPQVLGALPPLSATPAEYALQVILLLERRGILPIDLADQLRRARPERRAEIDACFLERLTDHDESPSLRDTPVPEPIARATALLSVHRHDWEAGGYSVRTHGCFNTTAEGAVRTVLDRLDNLAHLESTAPARGPAGDRAARRLELRFLYGAVTRWYELAQVELPHGLTVRSGP